MFSIDARSRVPIYEQLKQNIISLVATGVLASDDQLPSVRSLARELGVNPNTVQKAYQELEGQGFIYQAAGRGSFVAPCEAVAQSLSFKRLEDLRPPIQAAKSAGVSFEGVLKLVRQIYKREGERDD